jgi:NAD(P)H-hydrate epimerase
MGRRDRRGGTVKVVTVKQMERIESESDASGHSYAAMMEQAGRSLSEAIEGRQVVEGTDVLILVGPGNNGGDGLVAARYLSQAGARVTCYLYRDRDPAEDENFRLVLEGEPRAVLAEEDQGWAELRELAEEADIVIDGLLGTGTRLPLRGTLAEMLTSLGPIIARRRAKGGGHLTDLVPRSIVGCDQALAVVGIDGPTGLAYDSGELDPRTIPADLTVTFAYPKTGHFRFPGADAVGDLVVADIGIDPGLAEDVDLETLTPRMVSAWLPERSSDAHKGTFGRAMVAAGSVNYTGAAYLAGASATRAGAGLVTMALPSVVQSAVAAHLAEATYVLLPHAMGVANAAAADVLRDALEGYDALLIGPGLGRERETTDFLEGLLGGHERQRSMGFLRSEGRSRSGGSLPPLVIDADGLNILADLGDWPERVPPDTILTPHPGEMARLMGCSVDEVEADRVAVAREQAGAWRQVVVLKGAHTIVASPDGRVVIQPFANPGLATAGTGDVLAGTIVALRAQGLGSFESAAAGAFLHGLAGEIAREELGAVGMIAGDVLGRLPHAFQRLGVN